MKKRKKAPLVVLTLVPLAFAGYYAWHDLGHQAQLRQEAEKQQLEQLQRVEQYGDGRFLKVVSGWDDDKREQVLNSIADYQSLTAFVTGANLEEDRDAIPHELDLGLGPKLKAAFQSWPQTTSDEIWEGMKEISSLEPGLREDQRDISSGMGSLNNLSSTGHEAMLEEGAKGDDKALEMAQRDNEDNMKDIDKQMGDARDDRDDRIQRMDLVAALVISHIPETKREGFWKTLAAVRDQQTQEFIQKIKFGAPSKDLDLAGERFGERASLSFKYDDPGEDKYHLVVKSNLKAPSQWAPNDLFDRLHPRVGGIQEATGSWIIPAVERFSSRKRLDVFVETKTYTIVGWCLVEMPPR